MEISSACVSRLAPSPSILLSPFSDQSHVDFYYCTSSFASPSSLCLRSFPSRSSASLRALSDGPSSPLHPKPAVERAGLIAELAELKMLMKQKKKELKAIKKDGEKKLKMEMEKLKMEVKEGKMKKKKEKKMKCASSESSTTSSESSDGECETTNMKMLRQGCSLLRGPRVKGLASRADGDESFPHSEVFCCSVPSTFGTQSVAEVVPVVCRGYTDGEDGASSNVNVGLKHRDTPAWRDGHRQGDLPSVRSCASSSLSVQCPNRIEVCAGGKCKKAGSEKLLQALRLQIPSALNVEAVPCKCMGKCSMTMNVKVHKEDTNPQHHSHVGVADANFILSHHFGLGNPPSGLPSLPLGERFVLPVAASRQACTI